MVSAHDVPSDKLIAGLAAQMKDIPSVQEPDWARWVKTGSHAERPPDDFSVYVAAIDAGHPNYGVLPVTEPDPGVDPGDKEPLAAMAGETPEGWVETDVELELHFPCESGLFLRYDRVGA